MNTLNGYTPFQIQGADGTTIANTGTRLNVDTSISSVTAAISASFSSKTRVDVVTSAVVLSTGSFTTCYSYSGSGFLIGFSAEFNNTAIIPRLRIDGEDVFTTQTLATWGAFQVTTNTSDRRMNGQGMVINGANIDFSLRSPIRFTSSVNLAADANGGILLARSMSQALFYIVKET